MIPGVYLNMGDYQNKYVIQNSCNNTVKDVDFPI